MITEEFTPNGYLKPFIKCYRIFVSPAASLNRILPSTSFAIAFRLRGSISYVHNNNYIDIPSATIIGLQKSVSLISYAAETETLVVYFDAAGIAGLIKEPLYDLFEQSLALTHFISPQEIDLVEERLAELSNNRSKINLLEKYLFAKVHQFTPDLLIKEAISRIQLNQGLTRISKLAKELNISQDAFEKRFRRTVGITPKRFSSIIKLQRIVALSSPDTPIFDLAIDLGYYDHSHFIKDFKLFTGLTPTAFLQLDAYW